MEHPGILKFLLTGALTAIAGMVGAAHADENLDKLISEKKYREAVDYADEKIDPSQRNAVIWGKIGDAYDKLGMPEKSLASFLVSWRMNQGDYQSMLGAARAYNKLDNPEMAIEMAKKALDVNFTAEASWEYARACITLKRPAEAMKALAKVIESDSSNIIAVRELSNIYFTEGTWSQAVPLLKYAYRKNASPELAFQIGKAYTELGVPDSALSYLAKVKDAEGVALLLGRANFAKKQWGATVDAYKKAPESEMTPVDFYRLGCALEKTQGRDAAYDVFVKSLNGYGMQRSGQEPLLVREKVAVARLARKLYSDAQPILLEVVESDPDGKVVPRGYCMLAEAYAGLNDVSNAIATLEKAIGTNSRNIEAYAQLADLYQKNGSAEKAKKTFEVLIGLSPNDPSIYLVLGNYNCKGNQFAEALAQFEKSNSLKASAAAQEGISRAAYALKNGDLALSASEMAIKMDANLREARKILALVLIDRQKFTPAQEHLEKLLKQEPDNSEILLPLARCYEKNGKADQLYAIDKKIAGQNPADTTSRLRIARYCAGKNNLEDAIRMYQELYALNTSSSEVLLQLYKLFTKQGSIPQAVVFARKYIDLNNSNAEAHRDLGDLLYGNNDLDGALAEYRTALKLDPAIKGFHRRYADIVIAKGESDEVIKALKAVVSSGSADVSTYMTIGLMYQKKKEFIEAIENYQSALKLEPSNFDALTALGACQAANGEIRDAIISYEQAIMMNPAAGGELKELGDLYAGDHRDDEALRIYLKYLAKDSTNMDVARKAGRYLSKKGDTTAAFRYFAMAESQLAPDEAVDYATACIKKGKNSSAIKVLLPVKADRAIGGDTQRSAYLLLAQAYENDSNLVAASQAYADYLGVRGVDDNTAAYKQAALLEKNDPLAAQKIFELNCKRYPGDYRNFLKLALMYSERKDMLEKALPLFKRVTELADSIPKVWLELAKIYGKLGNDDEELQAYRKYAGFDPQSIEANRRIGTLLMRKGSTNEAIVFLEIVNTVAPNDPDVMTMLATGYVRSNRFDEAISLLNKAKAKKGEDPDIRFQLFELYQKNGHKDKAQKEIEELVAINREPRYLFLYVEALIIQGKAKEAAEAVEELLALDPDNIKTLLLQAKVLRLQKQYDEAIEIYKEINVIDPADGVSLYERAETHIEQSKPQWAETFYKRALRADPTIGRAELGLAKIAKSHKDMTLYRDHLERARQLSPDDELIIDELKKAGIY